MVELEEEKKTKNLLLKLTNKKTKSILEIRVCGLCVFLWLTYN